MPVNGAHLEQANSRAGTELRNCHTCSDYVASAAANASDGITFLSGSGSWTSELNDTLTEKHVRSRAMQVNSQPRANYVWKGSAKHAAASARTHPPKPLLAGPPSSVGEPPHSVQISLAPDHSAIPQDMVHHRTARRCGMLLTTCRAKPESRCPYGASDSSDHRDR